MQAVQKHSVLVDSIAGFSGRGLMAKEAFFLLSGVLLLAACAKIAVPMWPVPITMGTFAVLGLGAAYGPRRGLVIILLYMLCGAAGLNVFAGTSADIYGLSYMAGPTGGYLVGYVLATIALGFAARAGWDRSPLRMAGAMLVGNGLIYLPGLFWLGMLYGWDKPIFAWGVAPFLVGDALKLGLAAVLFPGAWKVIRKISG